MSRLISIPLLLLVLILGINSTVSAQQKTEPPQPLQPTIQIIGVKDGELKFTTNSANFKRSIFIVVVGAQSINNLTHILPNLVGPDSKTIETKSELIKNDKNDSTANTPPQSSAHVEISVTLPSIGEYSTLFTIVYENKPVTVLLKIIREKGTPPISITSPTSVAYDSILGDPIIRFTLQETSGNPVQLYMPVLSKLGRKVSQDRVLQVDYAGPIFSRQQPDGTIEPITAPLTIKGNESFSLQLKVAGLSDSGEFSGELSLSSENGSLVAQPFTIYLKRPYWFAAIFIAIGILISFLLRLWIKIERPRLLLQRRVLLLVQDLEEISKKLPAPPEQELIKSLRDRLQKLYDELGMDLADKPEDILKDINGKLSLVPLWHTLRMKLEAAKLPTIGTEWRALEDAADFIKSSQLVEAGATRKSLNDALTAVDKAVATALKSKIKELIDEAKSLSVELAPSRKDDFDRQVLQTLQEAEKLVQELPLPESQVQALIEKARRSYALIFANEFEEKLKFITKPSEMPPQDFYYLIGMVQTAIKEARNAASGTAAVTAVRKAYDRYLFLLVSIAEVDVASLRKVIKNPKGLEALKVAEDNLTMAQYRIAAGELAGARQAYEEARKKITEAREHSQDSLASGQEAILRFELTPAAKVLVIPDLLIKIPTPIHQAQRMWPDLGEIEEKIKLRDTLVAVIVGLIAIVLGLYLLWLGSLTWGSDKDIFTAILWGLGLHQVAGNVVGDRLDIDKIQGLMSGTAKP